MCCDLQGREIGFGYDDINPENLTHRQLIVIGWQNFIDEYREVIKLNLGKYIE